MKTHLLVFVSFLFVSTSCLAQKKQDSHLNLGFKAKMNHLSGLSLVKEIDEEPEVKKSNRTLAEILAGSKAKESQSEYHLIAGCFSTLVNAERFVDQLIKDSYNASVVGEQDDLFFVAFKTFKEYDEAIRHLAIYKAAGVDSWVKKM